MGSTVVTLPSWYTRQMTSLWGRDREGVMVSETGLDSVLIVVFLVFDSMSERIAN